MDYAQLLGMTGGNQQGAGIMQNALGGGNVGAQLLGTTPAQLPGAGFQGFAPTSTVPDLLAKYRAQAAAAPPVPQPQMQAPAPAQVPAPAPAPAPALPTTLAEAQLAARGQLLSQYPEHQRDAASRMLDENIAFIKSMQMGQPWVFDPYEAQGGMPAGLAAVIYGPGGRPTSPVRWGANDG